MIVDHAGPGTAEPKVRLRSPATTTIPTWAGIVRTRSAKPVVNGSSRGLGRVGGDAVGETLTNGVGGARGSSPPGVGVVEQLTRRMQNATVPADRDRYFWKGIRSPRRFGTVS
ncbi:hypothetical protein GCM10007298_19410 [Williamsia phyllosphaerae]|uniref:Uncharacterized protein n=1 Tax=Williamsia phyllosphaerae TaxID=885042 RepID=A0ABQ1UQD0_9NOCA|nr:hypothetical protein GCM10007298_19410 [Williamsia phyllosphaerae]